MGYDNAGVLALRCSGDAHFTHFMRAWSHLSLKMGTDQGALQLLTRHGSLYQSRAVYDTLVTGVYSDVFKHYPGRDKWKFPVDINAPNVTRGDVSACPRDLRVDPMTGMHALARARPPPPPPPPSPPPRSQKSKKRAVPRPDVAAVAGVMAIVLTAVVLMQRCRRVGRHGHPRP